jgi:hypothetical protein
VQSIPKAQDEDETIQSIPVAEEGEPFQEETVLSLHSQNEVAFTEETVMSTSINVTGARIASQDDSLNQRTPVTPATGVRPQLTVEDFAVFLRAHEEQTKPMGTRNQEQGIEVLIKESAESLEADSRAQTEKLDIVVLETNSRNPQQQPSPKLGPLELEPSAEPEPEATPRVLWSEAALLEQDPPTTGNNVEKVKHLFGANKRSMLNGYNLDLDNQQRRQLFLGKTTFNSTLMQNLWMDQRLQPETLLKQLTNSGPRVARDQMNKHDVAMRDLHYSVFLFWFQSCRLIGWHRRSEARPVHGTQYTTTFDELGSLHRFPLHRAHKAQSVKTLCSNSLRLCVEQALEAQHTNASVLELGFLQQTCMTKAFQAMIANFP